jgi:hypothetical protein
VAAGVDEVSITNYPSPDSDYTMAPISIGIYVISYAYKAMCVSDRYVYWVDVLYSQYFHRAVVHTSWVRSWEWQC